MGNEPYLLCLSRIHPKKGIDLLLRAYLNINLVVDPTGRGKLPRLVIAGPGLETEYGREILEIVRNKGKSSVHFHGMLEGVEKWGALHGAEAFMLPSHQENFGIAVVEALACSKPVLISDKVNIHTLISEAGAGLIAGDDLAGAGNLLATWLALGANKREIMGKAAADLFNREFRSPQAAERLIAAIKPLLAP